MNAIEAAAMFAPLVKALVLEAESTGASGPEKHAAVAAAAEIQYRAAQSAVKELRAVPWELVAPLIIPIEAGMISAFVRMFNTVWGKIWKAVKSIFASPEPAAA